MRKIIILFLSIISVVCIALGVSACSDVGDDSTDSNNINQSQIDDNTGGDSTNNEEKENPTESTHNLICIAKVDATCTTDGNIEYWYCPDCNKYFSDSNATTQIDLSDTIIKAGHTYNKDYLYDEDNHWQVCSICGEINAISTHVYEVSDDNGYTYLTCNICNYSCYPSNNLEYTLSEDETYYVVSGIGTCKDSFIVIPSTYNSLPVKGIGGKAFYTETQIESIFIPDSITFIKSLAFCGCSSLTSVYYSGTASQWASITIEVASTNPMYNGADLYLNGTLATDITIEGVTTINAHAFDGCTSITSITIGKGVTSVESYAFYECTSLTNVIIGNDVTTIGSCAFRDCLSLSTVTISNSVTSIGNAAFLDSTIHITSVYYDGTASQWASISFDDYYANPTYYTSNLYINETLVTDITIEDISKINSYVFYNCTSITSVTISDNVTSIGDYSFYGCSILESITIPNSVTSIGDSAFGGCSSLISIALPFVGSNATATKASSSTLFGYIFGTTSYDGGTTIKQYYASTSSNTYYIPSTLKNVVISGGNILYGAFYGCSELVSITIPDNLTSISDYAFYECSSLTSITMPDSITSIGARAFYNCSSLTSVTIQDDVTSIGDYAFYNCTALTVINFNATVMKDLSSKNYVFYGAGQSSDGITVNIDADVTKIPNYLFCPYSSSSYAPKITSIVFEDGSICKSIGNYSFAYCSKFTSITIPDSVTSIGNYAFKYCSSLASMTIGNNVTSIGTYAFSDCSSLASVTFKTTSGWYRTSTEGATSGTTISSTTLSDTSKAASNLTSYCKYYWYRSE